MNRSTQRLSAVCLFAFPATAFAYIDPVTGSIVIQSLIAAFAAIMVFFRSAREKIFGTLASLFKKKQDEENLEDSDSQGDADVKNDGPENVDER